MCMTLCWQLTLGRTRARDGGGARAEKRACALVAIVCAVYLLLAIETRVGAIAYATSIDLCCAVDFSSAISRTWTAMCEEYSVNQLCRNRTETQQCQYADCPRV